MIYNYFQMGNQTHSSLGEDFHNRYKFIEFVTDPNFGPIKVYRKTKMNFDYAMILKKYFDNQEISKLENSIKLIINSYSEENQTKLLKIHNYQIIESEHTKCNMAHMKLYIQYLNYTLHQFMDECLKKRESLTYQQMLYVLNCVIQVYEFCEGFDCNFFNCCSRTIFLTPDGYLKFIPLPLKDFSQKNEDYCNTFCTNTHRHILNYEKNNRQFMSQFKKLLNQMLELHHNVSKNSLIGTYSKEIAAIKKLEKNVFSTRNFQQLKKIIPKSEVDALLIRRKSQTSTQIGLMPGDYGHIIQSNLKFPVKKSMKIVKQSYTDY